MCFASFNHDTPLSYKFCYKTSWISSVLNSYSCLYPFLSETPAPHPERRSLGKKHALFFLILSQMQRTLWNSPMFPGTILLQRTKYLLFKVSLNFYHYYCATFTVGVKLHKLFLLSEYMYDDFECHRSGSFENLLFYSLFRILSWIRNILGFLTLYSKHYCLLFSLWK